MAEHDLRVAVGDLELAADWTDDNPTTREAVERALPLSGEAVRWGDELYFAVPVDVPAENASTAVPVGALAYWPAGDTLCLFWGPTPASHDDEPRAASPVNVVARVVDVEPLSGIDGGASVGVTPATE
ncbi:MAG: cyclophilin-like family protein [Salinigranum sp.]